VRTAHIKLNGNKVAEIVWPATAIVNADSRTQSVELDSSWISMGQRSEVSSSRSGERHELSSDEIRPFRSLRIGTD